MIEFQMPPRRVANFFICFYKDFIPLELVGFYE